MSRLIGLINGNFISLNSSIVAQVVASPFHVGGSKSILRPSVKTFTLDYWRYETLSAGWLVRRVKSKWRVNRGFISPGCDRSADQQKMAARLLTPSGPSL